MLTRHRHLERRVIAVGGIWLLQGAALVIGPGLLMQESMPLDFTYLREPNYLLGTVTFFLIVAALQAVLLWPIRSPAPRPGARPGASLWLSISVASLAAALLVGGILAALTDLVWLITGHDAGDAEVWGIGGMVLLSWAMFTPLLMAFCRRERRETALGAIAGALFLGTIVEAAAIIPLDVMVRRRTNCYCGQGTYWALIVCGSVGLFALGPAILVPLLGRRRKRWYAGHCDACGYDMSGTPNADRCPECGAGWRQDPPSQGTPTSG